MRNVRFRDGILLFDHVLEIPSQKYVDQNYQRSRIKPFLGVLADLTFTEIEKSSIFDFTQTIPIL